MTTQKIIMNFSTPPGLDDIQAVSAAVLEAFPEELLETIDGMDLIIEDFPNAGLMSDLEIEDEFELLACYSGNNELTGVVKNKEDGAKFLTLFRRPILDAWCETEEDLSILVRHIMIAEIGQSEGFSDEQTDEMIQRHHQGAFAEAG